MLSKVLKSVELNEQNPLVLTNLRTIPNKKNIIELPVNSEAADQKKLDDLLHEAQKKSLEILEKARIEAQEKIKEANMQSENIKQQAFKQGYEEGWKKAEETFLKENIKKWNECLEQFNCLRKNLVEKNEAYKKFLEKEALKLSLYIAEKILCQKINESSDYVLNLVKSGLEKIEEEKDVIVRISEQDFDRINISDFKQLEAKGTKISLIKDPLLSTGDCVIEGNSFLIDAGVHTRINNLKKFIEEMDVMNHD